MAIEYGDGSDSNTGRIIAVNTTQYETTTSLSVSTSWNDVPGVTVTITPESTSSKFIISGSVHGEWAAVGNNYDSCVTIGTLIGGTSTWIEPTGFGNRTAGLTIPRLSYGSTGDNDSTPEGFQIASYVVSPGTTSSVTFRFGMRLGSGSTTYYVNRSVNTTDAVSYDRFISWISAMEVAG